MNCSDSNKKTSSIHGSKINSKINRINKCHRIFNAHQTTMRLPIKIYNPKLIYRYKNEILLLRYAQNSVFHSE